MILRNIPPGLTTTIQLKVRTVGSDTPGSNVGSAISGSSSGSTYTYSLGAYATGDYWAVLSGVSDPVGSAFPVRDDVAYFVPWSIIEATVSASPTIPSPITGMCNLLVSTNGGAGSRVWAKLADTNNTANQVLVAQQVVESTTNSSGNATLVLIQYGQFTAGGTYRVRVATAGRVISNNVLVRMPNTSSANLEDLTPL
jgi:hypothetical protein